MKLIIQIPCYNEEQTLPITYGDLPKKIVGVDTIETLIIDDGSADKTVEVAKQLGVNHIVSLPQNKGLAYAFMSGVDACLRLGADIIVNTDGDNQYNGHDIEKLIIPILENRADMVVGDRQTDTIQHFSWAKKKLQKLGSWVVRKASKTNVTDATSGFRAYTRDAALKLKLMTEYSYVLETLIDAGRHRMAIENVKIGTNGKLRESRLFKNLRTYLSHSGTTILRSYAIYRPLKLFLTSGVILALIGMGIGVRFICCYVRDGGSGHIQSLILSAILILAGFQVSLFGILSDAIAANRRITEEILYRVRKQEYKKIDD
jgi:glycosyltransferase involved in cell wall biosynthesis